MNKNAKNGIDWNNGIKLLIFNAYLKVCPLAFCEYTQSFYLVIKQIKYEGCWNCSGILEDINYSNIYKVNGECQESEKEISRALNKMMTGRN